MVGATNRLANAAAARVSESPASAYNPLVLRGASGLGKTHLLMAIGNRVMVLHPERKVRYGTFEQLGDSERKEGPKGGLRKQLKGVGVLLLDDVQFLAGRGYAQEELLLAWDAVVDGGGQIVLAIDRAPNDTEGLQRRLASRMLGGLVADLAPPAYKTRVEIAQRRAAERGQTLAEAVIDQLARLPFANVRELRGCVNRVLAAQELESRLLSAEEVVPLLGVDATAGKGEFGSYLSELSGTLGEVLERLSPKQLLADAILRWEGEGYRTTRLDSALAGSYSPGQARRLVARFENDVARLRAAESDIRSLDPMAPELARTDLLRNPDAVAQAEALTARVRERLTAGEAEAGRSGRRGSTVITVAPNGGRRGSGSARTSAGTARQGKNGRGQRRPAGGRQGRGTVSPAAAAATGVADSWFLSPEKALWDWPYAEDAIVMESD